MRFVVTELTGFRSAEPVASHASPGTSFHVVDTLCNHRLCGTWRTEDYRGYASKTRARSLAEACAARLNGEAPPAYVYKPRVAFRPTCPRCDFRCDPDAIYCAECGTRLYERDSGKYGDPS